MKINRLYELDIQIIDGDRGVNYPKEKDFLQKGFCLFLNAKNVTNAGFNFDSCQFISKEKDLALGNGKLDRLDIVLTTRGTVGNIAFYDENIPFENIRINSGMVLLRNHDNKISHKYLHHFLKSSFFKKQIERISFGSAQPQLTVKTISNIELVYPQHRETQRKIARILSTADAVIEKTQTAIAKYKAIKQGMLHDLFARGIDPATNKLRPTYEDAPHLYKQSKLGWIPREWEVETFSEVVEIINGGTPSTHIKEYWNGEIPWLSVEDFNKEKRYVYDAIKKISEFGLKNSATNMLKKDMIIISARGTVGVIAQIGNDMAFNQSCYGINSLKKELTNDFIYYFLIYYKSEFGFSSFGSVFNTITRDYFDSMEIAIPSDSDCNEMIEITNKLSSIDYKIQTEQAYLHKLQQIKAGLMADLLTGKKEVRVDEEPVS
jgi:type I restriction enzyme S subunit